MCVYARGLHLVFLHLRGSRLVCRGHLRRRKHGKICQPRISQRAAMPHVRRRRCRHRILLIASGGQCLTDLPRRRRIDERTGMDHRLCAGKALSPTLVGLLRAALQHRRIHLLEILTGLGSCLPADSQSHSPRHCRIGSSHSLHAQLHPASYLWRTADLRSGLYRDLRPEPERSSGTAQQGYFHDPRRIG